MSKRTAELQICKETYSLETGIDVGSGTYRQASEAAISKRKILTPRSRLNGAAKLSASKGGGIKPVASPFGTFTFTPTVQVDTNAGFKIPAPSDMNTSNSSAAASTFNPLAFVGAAKNTCTESTKSPFNSFGSSAFGTAKSPTPCAILVPASGANIGGNSMFSCSSNVPTKSGSNSSLVAPLSPIQPLAETTSVPSSNGRTPEVQRPNKHSDEEDQAVDIPSTQSILVPTLAGQPAAPTSRTNIDGNRTFSWLPNAPASNGINSSSDSPIQPSAETTSVPSSKDNITRVQMHPDEEDQAAAVPNAKCTRALNQLETDTEDQRKLSELYAFLAELNRKLLAHISNVVAEYPVCDMANVLEDYQQARDEIIKIKCLAAAKKLGVISRSQLGDGHILA